MAFDFRLPNITGATEREQLVQIKSYLFTLVEQLQWAMNSIDTAPTNGSSLPTSEATKSTVASSSTAQASFSEIKALIIKSADIVNAYYEKIKKRLEGVYAAQSDFGAYEERTAQEIEASSTMIENAFTNIQTISKDIASVDASIQGVKDDVWQVDDNLRSIKSEIDGSLDTIKGELSGISNTIIAVTANIRSGLLFYEENGIPVYGFEVGQRTMIDGVEVFDKFARFTSDRLSFYDQNDNEVAYISDRKLYINNVEITGTFIMGGFVRTVRSDGSIVKRWVIQGGEA